MTGAARGAGAPGSRCPLIGSIKWQLSLSGIISEELTPVSCMQGVPLTQAVAQQSALPQLQVIGGAPAARPNNNLPAQPAGPAQPGLPGFPAAPGSSAALPNNNLVWVGLGGSGKQNNT